MIEALLAAALLAWALIRLRRPGARPPRPASRGRTGSALVWAGVLFATSAPLEPTFVGLVVLAGGEESVRRSCSRVSRGVVVSQLPLEVLAVAIVLGRNDRTVDSLRSLVPRMRPVLARFGTAALMVIGLLIAVDVVWWLCTGEFLLPDPT